jgi:hypothetical protein
MPASFKDTDPGNLYVLADWVERQAAGEQVERARLADEFRRMADAITRALDVPALPEWRI